MGEPWERVRHPVPIPDPLTVEHLADLPDAHFAELLRSHLLPPSDKTSPQRKAWHDLWAMLASNASLADRAYDVLEDFLDAAEEFLDEAGGEAPARARKFIQRCDEAWDRLDRDDRLTLRRTAVGPARYVPAARPVIERLVQAIVEHRATVFETGPGRREDRQLWAALGELGLDPETWTPQPARPPRRPSAKMDRRRLAKYNPAARIDIRHLVGAIVQHRTHVTGREFGLDADHELWSVLRQLKLDPRPPGASD